MKNSDCLKMSIVIMEITGVWIRDYTNNMYKRSFYLFMFLAIVVAEISHLVLVLGNTKDSVDAMVLLFSHLVQGVKLFTIWIRQGKIQELIALINGPEFTRKEEVTSKILEKTVKYSTIIGNCILGSAGVTVIFWNVMPLLKDTPTLPLHTAYPFDVYQSPRFEMMYVYTAICVTLLGLSDAAMNYLVAGLMTLAGAQLDVLVYELEHIKVKNNTINDKIDAHRKVIACVNYHQRIISYVKELGTIFGTTMFCQFLTSSLVICLTVFKITISTEPIEVTTMVFYLICVFMELLMYCYPGDIVLNKSVAVSKAAYSCDWVSCEVRTRKLLLLMAVRAQRQLVIKAGGVYPVSLPTAAAVVQTAYSYYAMLKQTQNH